MCSQSGGVAVLEEVMLRTPELLPWLALSLYGDQQIRVVGAARHSGTADPMTWPLHPASEPGPIVSGG
ncbi:hypothetical protein [Streptomyces sp. NPDC001020]